MPAVQVTPIGSAEFHVEVSDAQGTSEHRVTVPAGYPDQLGLSDGAALADLVRESFRFLLEREPKEQILRTFELDAIERFFPEYRERIGDRVGGS